MMQPIFAFPDIVLRLWKKHNNREVIAVDIGVEERDNKMDRMVPLVFINILLTYAIGR